MSLDIEQAKEFVRWASKEDKQKFKDWCEEWDFHLDFDNEDEEECSCEDEINNDCLHGEKK